MVKISEEKRDRIKSNILAHLYEHFPRALFTAEISKLEARDEEFTKTLLKELWDKNLVIPIRKNSHGVTFSRRIKWRLSNKAYEAYKQHQ
jgi:predicted transcriptional regulator with HTH domain